jgi:hypothetical protein
VPLFTASNDQEATVLHVLSTAGRAGIRAVVAAIIVYAAGIAAAPSLDKLLLFGVALLVAFFAAALRVIQAYLPGLSLAKYLGHPYGDWADSFLQGFVAALIVGLPGIAGAPNLSAAGGLVVALILGAFTAGARAAQGLLTRGESPAPATGIAEPPNHYSYALGAPVE